MEQFPVEAPVTAGPDRCAVVELGENAIVVSGKIGQEEFQRTHFEMLLML